MQVENESGLSNFIPVLIGDKEICSEMKIIQQRYDASHSSNGSDCEVSALRQMTFSEFVVDVAWLTKEPLSENFQKILTPSQIQRFNSLLKFLLHHESTTILDKILQNMKIMMNKMEVSSVVDRTSAADRRLLQKYMDSASVILSQKLKKNEALALHSKSTGRTDDCVSGNCSEGDLPSIAPTSEVRMSTFCT